MSVVDVLKPHNLEAFEEINEMLESGIKKIAVPRATGSGKTYLMGAVAEKYNDDPKLVLEPSNPLLRDIKDKFEEFGIDNTDFITYQKLIRMSDEDIAEMDYKMIFLDEFHHGTAPVWGQKIDYLMKTHSESVVFGISATIVRNDGVNVVETLFDNNAIEELSLSTAIARKVLPCPHYITAIYRLDDEFEKLKKRIDSSTNTKEEKQEFIKKMQEMKKHFEKSYGIPLILNKYIKVRDGRYLVFCKDKKHLNAMRDVVINWFQTAGIKDLHSYAVYSDYPDKEKDYKDFCEDDSESLKILFSINMLNEGVHVKNISGVLMLRTTQSNLIYLQQLGRLVEADNIDKYLLVFDFVNNFLSVNDGIGLLKEIKNAIAREKEKDPNFDDTGFEDIDTFFVIEQILQVEEMFKEIEGRLKDDWDLYIKALKQYKERKGDCLVPSNYEEIINGGSVKLGQWINDVRQMKKKGYRILTEEMILQLNQLDFIWDVYQYKFENNIKALKQYKNRKGNCIVNRKHIELVEGISVNLGQWCQMVRSAKNKTGSWKLTNEMEKELNEVGFIWNIPRYTFEENIKFIKNYYMTYLKYPSSYSEDLKIKKLGDFLNNEKANMRKARYPEWKKEIINRYLPEFSCETRSDKSFNEFVHYAKLCKERYGCVKGKFKIDGYNIGAKLCSIKKSFRKGTLSKDKIRQLENLGIYLGNENEKYFADKIEYAKQAIKEGIVISNIKPEYEGINLYDWLLQTVKRRYDKNKLSQEQINIVEKLVGKPIYIFFNNGNFVKIMDVIEKKEVGIYKSQKGAINSIQEKYDIKIGNKVIRDRLTGKITTPYKGRFMFYYADKNEEVTE